MKTVAELKIASDAAERELRFANLRHQWMERRLLDASTELEFDSLLAELAALEGKITDLATEAVLARAAWTGADVEARRAAQG